jgi:hypothetical protein
MENTYSHAGFNKKNQKIKTCAFLTTFGMYLSTVIPYILFQVHQKSAQSKLFTLTPYIERHICLQNIRLYTYMIFYTSSI